MAFKLCEGQYQVELVRCLRKHLLDIVVMGYQPTTAMDTVLPIDTFALKLPYPLVIVGRAGPDSFLLNEKALGWLEYLDLPAGSWERIELETAT